MEQYELKKEVLGTALEYIERVLPGVEEIIECFQTGREDKATSMMIELIEGMQWLIQAIDGTTDLQGEHSIDTSQINSILNQLVEAYENMDYVLLSDLLEYELLPLAKTWKEKLVSIQGVLGNDS